MRRTILNVATGIAFIISCGTGAAFAADPILTTRPATQSTSKEEYTLFNPVPAEQLRGMDTDRPNQTNTSHTIDAGHLQIETWIFDYTSDRDRYQAANARTDAFEFGQFNFRLGVLNQIEVHAVFNSAD